MVSALANLTQAGKLERVQSQTAWKLQVDLSDCVSRFLWQKVGKRNGPWMVLSGSLKQERQIHSLNAVLGVKIWTLL